MKEHGDLVAALACALLAIVRGIFLPQLRVVAGVLFAWAGLELVGFADLAPLLRMLRFVMLAGVVGVLLVARRPHRIVPVAGALVYGAALWFAKGLPGVRARWTLLLQVPSAVLFVGALWLVAMRLVRRRANAPRDALTLAQIVGLVLALGDGVLLAAGLWASWSDVRVFSLVEWLVVGVILATAR